MSDLPPATRRGPASMSRGAAGRLSRLRLRTGGECDFDPGHLLDVFGRLARGRRFDVRLPYGPADWTVLLLHAFWDSWIHERDVLLARGADHPTDGDATAYATAYGVFIAASVASMFGDQVREKLTLGGDGGGVFDVDGRRGVTITVDRVTAAGPRAAEVADALAGRAPIAAALPDLPASSRAALSRMADVFRAPAGQAPT